MAGNRGPQAQQSQPHDPAQRPVLQRQFPVIVLFHCYSIAWNILYSREDSDECLNDTWLGAWNAMPPQRPERLPPFLGRIARNTAETTPRLASCFKTGGMPG